MSVLAFTVYGIAQPAGSKRAFANKKTSKIIVTDDNAKSRPWKQEVACAAREAMDAAGIEGLINGPVELHVTFLRPRPRGHFRTGRNAHLLRDSAPAWPTTKPDALKLARGLEDALTGTVWRDDSQVVVETISKEFGEPARAAVFVRALDAVEALGVRAVTPTVGKEAV